MYENRIMDNMGGILRLAEADFFLKTYIDIFHSYHTTLIGSHLFRIASSSPCYLAD